MFDLTWPEAGFTLLLFSLVAITGWLPRLGDALGDFLYGYGQGRGAGRGEPGATRDGS